MADRTTLDGNTAPARALTVYTVELDGEAVLLDEQRDRLHLLNHTATLLWSLYDGATTLADLAIQIADELGVDRQLVLDDLVATSRHFDGEGLLEGHERTATAGGA